MDTDVIIILTIIIVVIVIGFVLLIFIINKPTPIDLTGTWYVGGIKPLFITKSGPTSYYMRNPVSYVPNVSPAPDMTDPPAILMLNTDGTYSLTGGGGNYGKPEILNLLNTNQLQSTDTNTGQTILLTRASNTAS
jgi:hypothetical protein